MAYNLSQRFPSSPTYYRFLDPGSYQYGSSPIKQNRVPFLSRAPRVTLKTGTIWTHTIHNAKDNYRIPNCTAFITKTPRFPYEALSKEDLEEILCRCGFEQPCKCPVKEEIVPQIVCQGRVSRIFFKGSASRGHDGNSIKPPTTERVDNGDPPFYNTKVYESTAFYQGCKWSKWTSQRSSKTLEVHPGPAYYIIEKTPTYSEICAEKLRSQRRKTSKQLRYIEMVQQRNILEGYPGPATYYPELPKDTDLTYLGPRAERFPILKLDIRAGPADHNLKRDFDLPGPPERPCHAVLPEPACFGGKAKRFKPQVEQGPSPASYDVNQKPYRISHCPQAPFNTSAKRFQDDIIVSSSDEGETKEVKSDSKACVSKTWGFKSKTIRMKPLIKKIYEPSPADLAQSQDPIVKRSRELQYRAPFSSSEGRFQPWNDWMPVLGRAQTPGPCYYNLQIPKCLPAVRKGPLFRAPRFGRHSSSTPSPNEYRIGGGLETILQSHNKILKDNIENQHKFIWEPPRDPEKIGLEEKESRLLKKCIALLETDDNDRRKSAVEQEDKDKKNENPKLLRCFLYNKQIPNAV